MPFINLTYRELLNQNAARPATPGLYAGAQIPVAVPADPAHDALNGPTPEPTA
jgi:hypothetical protein